MLSKEEERRVISSNVTGVFKVQIQEKYFQVIYQTGCDFSFKRS